MVETIKVLADYSIDNIGGNAYDRALAKYFANQFNQQPSRKGKK